MGMRTESPSGRLLELSCPSRRMRVRCSALVHGWRRLASGKRPRLSPWTTGRRSTGSSCATPETSKCSRPKMCAFWAGNRDPWHCQDSQNDNSYALRRGRVPRNNLCGLFKDFKSPRGGVTASVVLRDLGGTLGSLGTVLPGTNQLLASCDTAVAKTVFCLLC